MAQQEKSAEATGTNKERPTFGRAHTRRWQRFLLWAARTWAGRLQRIGRARAIREAERLGAFAFQVSHLFARRPINYALRNLRLTQFPTPNATQAEREAFIRRVFINFCKGIVDFLRGPVITPQDLETLVRADGFEHAEAARQAGKGIIFVTAHLGSWEMLGRWLAAHGLPLTVVAREPENPDFADYVRELRENAGFNVVYRGASVRSLLQVLRSNRSVGLLPDQNSGDVFLPFFGVPAGTPVGPATLALHTGAALIPTYCVREPDDTYRLLILPPIDTHPTGDRDADVNRITADVNRVLESVVRQYPDQWLWLHNRWKSAFEDRNLPRAWPEGRDPAVWERWKGITAS